MFDDEARAGNAQGGRQSQHQRPGRLLLAPLQLGDGEAVTAGLRCQFPLGQTGLFPERSQALSKAGWRPTAASRHGLPCRGRVSKPPGLL